ncbi:type II secretion system F family protein [Thauera sp. Sel9]|uniref:type II secretion system F family protein n=1 Tax=Thauera sp. Sel9 TaxID=2974299 RepID=UPI0021E11FD4|nr:type II secretion system F family protein [Thauera sp. Sel9]MCV2218290.1 type II secretion system F family protein [Thauera sp. Sel9]
MKTYSYRAMSADGRLLRGRLDAADLADLESRLREQGLAFINGEARLSLSLPGSKRVPRRELIHFCFHLEQLLAAGVPPFESLAALRDATTHPRMRTAVITLLADIERGQPLSAAAARQPGVFPPATVALLRAGEQAGRLPETIRDIGAALEHEDELANYARRIAIYPAIVASLMLLAVVVALVHVVPELEKLFLSSGQTLPLQTRLLIGLSHAVTQAGWLLPAGIAIGLAGVRGFLARSDAARTRLHHLLLRLPVAGEILTKLTLARFASVLATLYAAGITIIDALRITQDITGNLALRKALHTATGRIEQGYAVSAAFEATGLFPPLVERMLRVGEQTGGLDRALGNVAALYRRDVADATARLQAAIEPLLTLAMGALLLWIASAVLGPIYDIITRLPT